MNTHHGYAYPAKYLCCLLLTCLLLLLTVSALIPEIRDDGNRMGDHPVRDAVTDAADAVGDAAKGAGRALGDAVSDIGDAADSVIDGARDAMDGSRDRTAETPVMPRTGDAAVPDANASEGSGTTVTPGDSGSFSWILVLILVAAAAAIFFLLLMPRRGRSM